MNIALIWPESTFLIDPMVYPPLGLFYIRAMLEENGHTVDFYDMSHPYFKDVALTGNVNWYKYSQVWISGTTPQLSRIKYWLGYFKHKGIHTVVGGPHVMSDTDSVVGLADTVVVGEITPENVQRIVYEDGGVILCAVAPTLDDYPLPNRSSALKYFSTLGSERSTTDITSLGCPFSCAFCSSKRLYGAKVRYFPLTHVLDSIEQIASMGFGAIQFYDDILPIKKERTMLIADKLYDLRMYWRCFMRSDLAVKAGFSFLSYMRDAGLSEILVGVESAVNHIKDNVGKGTTVEQDTELLQWCKQLGISYKASIILGLPGETAQTMEATKQWLLKNKPDRVDVNTLIPMPGTPIMDNASDYGCEFATVDMETYFYKGREEEVRAVVNTKELTTTDIERFRLDLLNTLRAEGIPY